MGERREYLETRLDSWKDAVIAHFLLAGYWLGRASPLREILARQSKKLAFFTAAGIIMGCYFITLSIVGMVDGADMVRQLLEGNWLVYSQFLQGPGIYSFLVIFAVLMLLGFLIPLGLNAVLNFARVKATRQSSFAVFLCSAHCMLAILLFTPIVHVITLLVTWQPVQLTHLISGAWQNIMIYLFLIVVLASLVGWVACSMKMLLFSWPRAIIGPAITLVLLVALVMVLL